MIVNNLHLDVFIYFLVPLTYKYIFTLCQYCLNANDDNLCMHNISCLTCQYKVLMFTSMGVKPQVMCDCSEESVLQSC